MTADLKPEQVRADLLDAACARFFGTPAEPGDDRAGMARALAGVLPAFERMVCEQVAREIETSVCPPGEQCPDRFCPDCTRYEQAQRDAQIARGAR